MNISLNNAAIWNLVCAYQTILWVQEGKRPQELYDLPRKIILPDPYGEYSIEGWVDEKPNIVAATEAKLDEMKREAYKEQPKKQ